MVRFTKQIIKKIFNLLRLDVSKISQNPMHNFLGLKQLPIRTIIDVGANKGQFAKMISNVFPESNIYCFEPLPAPFKELSKWRENKNEKVKVFNFALGDREGDVKMFYHLKHSPSSSLLKTTEINKSLYPFTEKQIPISVKLTTLDKVMAELSLPLISETLIKLDVQGYEDCVIRGGAETLRKARACIVEVSLDRLYENQATFKDILLLLNDLGFQYAGNLSQTFAKDGHVVFFDAMFFS